MIAPTGSSATPPSWPSEVRNFVALSWSDPNADADALADQIGRALGRTWRCDAANPGLRIWTPKARPPQVFVDPSARVVIIGDRHGRSWQPNTETSADAIATQLCAHQWGRYVALFRPANGPISAVFRDPSGGQDAVAWRKGPLTLVASDLLDALDDFGPDDLAINWDVLGAGLVERLHLVGSVPLVGVTSTTPGALRHLTGRQDEMLIWRPEVFAGRAWRDTPQARGDLVEAIDGAVSALTGVGGGVLAEISGGLDSSIVASAMRRTHPDKVRAWVNFHVADASGDERQYARATARLLGVDLVEALKADASVDLQGLGQGSRSAQPSFRLVDAAYDQDMALRCRALDADQILSGLGGDTVFMQGGSPWLAADLFRERPPWAWRAEDLLTIARHARTSVWRVARNGFIGSLGGGGGVLARPVHLTPKAHDAATRRPTPLWMAAAQGLSPAKRSQVLGLARTLQVTGRSIRTEAADVVNPLLAQPVMEIGLSMSALALTNAGDDRAFAREAFVDRLAPEVRRRRSKGDLSRHYGMALGRATPQLREFLLEGRLAYAGLLQTEALDTMLTPEHLIWSDPYREIIAMVVLELWARSWADRLSARRLG
jgi:asparagine synthase (glutamine-hydrolysing)